MKNLKIVLIFAFILTSSVLFAQDTYKITFYAYGSSFWETVGADISGEPYAGGHTSIELQSYGTFGFYPTTAWSGKTGIVKNDSGKKSEATYTFTTSIDKNKYIKVKNLMNNWRQNPPVYNIGRNDCVSFGMRIAEAAGLDFHWTTTQTPKAFIKSLNSNN